ncbi:hypothetical protein FPOAC2_04509 [Fusarium poae]|jgi:hypothetical protein|uniref:Uncharacterized protein n=1 Tax=Fusarium poae TaxID=36050 RepID=A0A1B8ASV1_FUSPO|nr:hypothetical protein FPOAC1_004425 [Fusarium poae]KAG8671186.1 hypothetical protein FPOAC1_004425 [Fusarium poae]OBS23446.1 hypothetical protein FPOA_03995 [Fusarium poae]
MKRSVKNAEHVGLFTPTAGQHFREEVVHDRVALIQNSKGVRPDNQSKMKRSVENAEHVGLFTLVSSAAYGLLIEPVSIRIWDLRLGNHQTIASSLLN